MNKPSEKAKIKYLTLLGMVAIIVVVVVLGIAYHNAVPDHNREAVYQPLKNFTKADENTDNIVNGEKIHCDLTIDCKTALKNEKLRSSKKAMLPDNGVILTVKKASFVAGETPYDVLRREMRKRKIPMESVKSPVAKTQYIKGISHLYEFDCGNLSGWMYKVNGEMLNVGCSQYQLKPGDRIEFIYTCKNGKDIGGGI